LRRSKKEQVVAELAELLAEHAHIILTGYRGLTVKELMELRRALAHAGGRTRVVKKTLLRRALSDDARAALAEDLAGPVAATFVSGDAIAVVREMHAYARTHDELEFQRGWIESQLFDSGQLAELATLPPREELLGRLVGVLSAPLSQLVGTLQAGPRDLVLTLQAVAQQREDAGAAAAA